MPVKALNITACLLEVNKQVLVNCYSGVCFKKLYFYSIRG